MTESPHTRHRSSWTSLRVLLLILDTHHSRLEVAFECGRLSTPSSGASQMQPCVLCDLFGEKRRLLTRAQAAHWALDAKVV